MSTGLRPIWIQLTIHIFERFYAPAGMGMGILATQYTQHKLIRTDGIWPHLLRVWRSLSGKLDLTQKFYIEATLSLPINNSSYFTMGGCPLKSKGESVGLVKLGDFFKFNRRTNLYKPMVEPEVHENHWRKREIQLNPQLADALLQCIPLIEGPSTFPLGKCVLTGKKIKNFRTKIGRFYKTSKGENITPEWKETSSDSIRWEIAWMCWKKRPSESKRRALRWRLLKHRLVTDIITNKWTEEPNIYKRCTTNAVETIIHAYLECPGINRLWQTVDGYVCRILGVRAHESTKEDSLFGADYNTMGYQREVVSTVHDAAIWIIYRSRLSIIMDNPQPSEITLAEQLGHEIQKIVRSKWWSASIKDKKEDLQELW
ncbi:uncharacterized protein VTP21DRAFT_11577 [Calcarisporiella thermophila]|uniref:uncharacterized protein n=1 Tax=Calcarisporiella thermophila TaxID=911321 RepID=UPI0037420886